jgi:LPS-assembly lipoprotein
MLWVRGFILSISLALTGCFTPLYGVKSDGSSAQAKLKQVDIAPIGGRLGIMMRNELVYHFSGTGEEAVNPVYRLFVTHAVSGSLLVVDTQAGRPEAESFTVNSTYRLVEIASGKEIFKSAAFASASVDTTQQRFARDRGRMDAHDRATKVVADQITTHVATFFATK